MANELEDPFAEIRRRIEKLLGYPRGAFDPGSNFLRDMERINRALGGTFMRFQDLIDPRTLLDRIKALHPDEASFPGRQAIEDIFNLPRQMWELRPPPPDGFFRRY